MAGKTLAAAAAAAGMSGRAARKATEAEVLSTLLAERYERRSVMVTSNLVVQPVGPERPGAEPPVTGPLRNSVE